jgi:hypothetical protein
MDSTPKDTEIHRKKPELRGFASLGRCFGGFASLHSEMCLFMPVLVGHVLLDVPLEREYKEKALGQKFV